MPSIFEQYLTYFASESDAKMGSNIKLRLASGQDMPALGFGTWQASEEEIMTALDAALEAGYRHIDCAAIYQNEKAIGKVLKEWMDSGKVKREELFIVTKLPPGGSRPSGVNKWLTRSLTDLQLDYVDLYLIHLAVSFEEVEGEMIPFNENGEIRLDMTTDHLAIWAEMEMQVDAGRTRAIGLSNFTISQISRILDVARIPVSSLQIELHIYFQETELVEFCRTKGIAVTAYSPLGTRALVQLLGKTEVIPDMLIHPVVVAVAEKHKKSSAQILLRHILQKGFATIPKSTTPERIRENIHVFDFQLDSKDMEELDNLDQGTKGRICDYEVVFKGIEKHPEYSFYK